MCRGGLSGSLTKHFVGTRWQSGKDSQTELCKTLVIAAWFILSVACLPFIRPFLSPLLNSSSCSSSLLKLWGKKVTRGRWHWSLSFFFYCRWRNIIQIEEILEERGLRSRRCSLKFRPSCEDINELITEDGGESLWTGEARRVDNIQPLTQYLIFLCYDACDWFPRFLLILRESHLFLGKIQTDLCLF